MSYNLWRKKMAITWKSKKTKASSPKFYHATGGMVLKLYKTRGVAGPKRHVWCLDFSCYTNGKSTLIGSKLITVNMAPPTVYYGNLKNRASKVAKRMVGHYADRIDVFAEALVKP